MTKFLSATRRLITLAVSAHCFMLTKAVAQSNRRIEQHSAAEQAAINAAHSARLAYQAADEAADQAKLKAYRGIEREAQFQHAARMEAVETYGRVLNA